MGANDPLPNDGFDILSYLTAPDDAVEENPLLNDCPTGLFGAEEPVDVAPHRRHEPLAPLAMDDAALADGAMDDGMGFLAELRADAARAMNATPAEPAMPQYRPAAEQNAASNPDFPNPFRFGSPRPPVTETSAGTRHAPSLRPSAPVSHQPNDGAQWGGRMTDIRPPAETPPAPRPRFSAPAAAPVPSSPPPMQQRRLPHENVPRSSAPLSARHPGDREGRDAAMDAELERRMAARAALKAANPHESPSSFAPRSSTPAPAPSRPIAPPPTAAAPFDAPAARPPSQPAAAPAAPARPRTPELSRHKISEIRDVDILVSKGRAAFEAGQTGLSAALFQRAYQLAPFRDDVRRWLEQALEEQAIEATSGGNRPASVGAPGIYYKHEVDAVLNAPDALDEGGNLPAPTRSTLAIFRPSTFRWVWGTAVALIFIGVVLAGWPVLSEAAGRLIDLRSPSVREAERLLAEANEADAIGRADVARDTLVTALKLEDLPPELTGTISDRLGEVHHRIGNKHFLDNDFDEAIAEFEAAIEADPEVAVYYGDLAMAHYLNAKGSWSRLRGNGSIDKEGLKAALLSFDRALKLDNSKVQWLWSAADCHVRMGNTPLAIEFWRQIARSDDPGEAAYIEEARKALKSHGIEA